jgi:hypothetical protein
VKIRVETPDGSIEMIDVPENATIQVYEDFNRLGGPAVEHLFDDEGYYYATRVFDLKARLPPRPSTSP